MSCVHSSHFPCYLYFLLPVVCYTFYSRPHSIYHGNQCLNGRDKQDLCVTLLYSRGSRQAGFHKSQYSLNNRTMDPNTGLAATADMETVMNAKLDQFASMFKNVVVIDDDVPLEKWAKEYLQGCSKESVAFFDCTSVLNQYKTWFSIFGDVQPFYGRLGFVSQ